MTQQKITSIYGNVLIQYIALRTNIGVSRSIVYRYEE